MTSTGNPPILRPRWSSASSNELRMSLPIMAAGPLKVVTKPIFTYGCAIAGCMVASARAAAPKTACFTIILLHRYRLSPGVTAYQPESQTVVDRVRSQKADLGVVGRAPPHEAGQGCPGSTGNRPDDRDADHEPGHRHFHVGGRSRPL